MTLTIWDFVASFGIILFGYIFSVFILMIEYFYTVCSKHFCKTKKKVRFLRLFCNIFSLSLFQSKYPSPALGDPYLVQSYLIILVLAYFKAKILKANWKWIEKIRFIKEVICNFLVLTLHCKKNMKKNTYFFAHENMKKPPSKYI